ncbi:hypothetical protein [Pseudomonas anguilliseptica]|uniref:hypothetical protein n=1 Tax=Pseudomonas anguilliseptica TaxID=53406 RepID=UPI00325AEF0D
MSQTTRTLRIQQRHVLFAGSLLLLGLLALSLATGAGQYGAADVLGFLLGNPSAWPMTN